MQFGEALNLSIDKTAAQASIVCGSIVVAKMIVSNFMNGAAKMAVGNRAPED